MSITNYEVPASVLRISLVGSLIITLFFLGLGTGAPAFAAVKITEQTKYYSFRAKNGKQLHARLARRAPWRLRTKHAIAATTRSYDLKNIKFGVRKGKCVVTNVDLHVSLVYHYPKWTNSTKGSQKLQKLWNRFSRELVRHEKTHGKYFKETARQVEKEILRTKGKLSNNCNGMDASVDQRLKKINTRGSARHVAFDKREKRPSSNIRKLERAIFSSN